MKYILIEVANRELNHLVYDDLDKAKAALCALYNDFCDDNDLDKSNEHDCWIDDDNVVAYANGKYDQLDWTIIEA
jgi:hypothetical protein